MVSVTSQPESTDVCVCVFVCAPGGSEKRETERQRVSTSFKQGVDVNVIEKVEEVKEKQRK